MCQLIARLLMGSLGIWSHHGHSLIIQFFSRYMIMLNGVDNRMQPRISAVISDVKADAGKRSADMAEMRKATHEALCGVENRIREMQVYMTERESQAEAQVESRLSGLKDELFSRIESSTSKMSAKASSASVDVECMLCDDDDDDILCVTSGNLAPRFGDEQQCIYTPYAKLAPVGTGDTQGTHNIASTTTQPFDPSRPARMYTAHTADKDSGSMDEVLHFDVESPRENTARCKGFGEFAPSAATATPATSDLGGTGIDAKSALRADSLVPTPGKPIEWAADTTLLSLSDSSRGSLSRVRADVSPADDTRTCTRAHSGVGIALPLLPAPPDTHIQYTSRPPRRPPLNTQHAQILHSFTPDPGNRITQDMQAYTLRTIGERAELLHCAPPAPTSLADQASGTSSTCADVYMSVGHDTQPTHLTRPYMATMQPEDILLPPPGFADTSRRTHDAAGAQVESHQQYTLPGGTQGIPTTPVGYGIQPTSAQSDDMSTLPSRLDYGTSARLRPRRPSATAFVDYVSACRSTYRACYHRRPSLPGGCCICLEQSAGDSTFVAVTTSFPQ